MRAELIPNSSISVITQMQEGAVARCLRECPSFLLSSVGSLRVDFACLTRDMTILLFRAAGVLGGVRSVPARSRILVLAPQQCKRAFRLKMGAGDEERIHRRKGRDVRSVKRRICNRCNPEDIG